MAEGKRGICRNYWHSQAVILVTTESKWMFLNFTHICPWGTDLPSLLPAREPVKTLSSLSVSLICQRNSLKAAVIPMQTSLHM